MRLLLDHCVDRRFAKSLSTHQVRTAHEMGWEQLRNGELLAKAAAEFDVLVTVDRNLKHQQNLSTLPIAVIVLIAKSSRLSDLVSLVPALNVALTGRQPRTLIEVGSST